MRTLVLRAGMLVVLMTVMSVNAIAGDARDKLKPGEAYVILKASGRILNIRFQEFRGKDSFTGNYQSFGRLIKVKAGRYYLWRIQSAYENVSVPEYPEPTNVSDTLDIREGAVTYIGDWIITDEFKEKKFKYSVDVQYNGATVIAAVQENDVTGIDLLMSRLGKPVVKMQLGAAEKKQE
jgi:hypothetical protein